MSVQSNQANDSSNTLSVFSCAFVSPVTAGDTITVGIGAASFVSQLTLVSVTDNIGNTYTQLRTFAGGTSGNQTTWLVAAVAIAAGTPTVTVTLSGTSNDGTFSIFINEGPPANAVRVSNVTGAIFGGTALSTSLAGTASTDYCVEFVAVSITAAVAPTPGNFGTNAATSQQTAVQDSGNYGYLLADGTSSGGTINATATVQSGTTTQAILAVAFFSVPTISVQPASANVVIGGTNTFSVTAAASSGGGSLSYQWKKNGTNIVGATASTFTTPTLTVDNNRDVYAVVVTDSNGSITSANAILTVFWRLTGTLSVAAIGELPIASLPGTVVVDLFDVIAFGAEA